MFLTVDDYFPNVVQFKKGPGIAQLGSILLPPVLHQISCDDASLQTYLLQSTRLTSNWLYSYSCHVHPQGLTVRP